MHPGACAVNALADSGDEDAYGGDKKEFQQEVDERPAAQILINQKGWDAASEVRAVSPTTGREIDFRLDWGKDRSQMNKGADDDSNSSKLCLLYTSDAADE